MAKILVIDDNDLVLHSYKRMLELAGHQVVGASNGNEGTRLYREDPADVVITDMVMPEKDGMETIMELRRDFPEVKIIAVSGGGTIGPYCYLMTARRLGANRILTKPIDRSELVNAVGEVVGA